MTISEELITKLKELNLPIIIIPIVENTTTESIIKCSDNTCCESCTCFDDSSNCICSAECPNCNCNGNGIISDVPLVIDDDMNLSKQSKKLTTFTNKYKGKNKGKKCGWDSDSCCSDDWDHHDHHGGHGHHDWYGGWHAKEPSKKLSSKKLAAFINKYKNSKSKKSKGKKCGWDSDSCCSDDWHGHHDHHGWDDWHGHHGGNGWYAKELSSRKKPSKSLPTKKKNKKKHFWSSDSSSDSWCSDDSWDHHGHHSHHDWHLSPPKNARKYKSSKKGTKLKAKFPVFEKYIIAFNDLTNDQTKDKINQLKNINGFKLKHSIMHTIKGCTATIDKQLAIELLMDPDIQYIEKDSIYSDQLNTKDEFTTMAVGTPLWHQTMTNTEPKDTDNFSTVHCYVMDTGIMTNHAEFSSNQIFMAYNAINKSINAQDDNGHGTCVASLIGGKTVGISNRVTLHSVKVLDSSGSGYVSDIIAGLNWIKQYKKPNSIINMSFGGSYSKSLDTVIKQCILANIPIVCSSGNSGIDASNSSPANSSSVYTISAYDSNKTRPAWANFGPVVTTFAPGESVKAAWNDSTSSYYLVGGTSFSCPITVGIIARFLAVVPNATLLQITNFLNTSEINNEIINIGSINTPNRRLVFNQANTII